MAASAAAAATATTQQHAKKLLTFTIHTPTKVWMRSLLHPVVPNTAELMYYYKDLCDLPVVKIDTRVEDIPVTFQESLLGKQDRAPTKFPANDLETAPEDEARRTQYMNYIQQVCEMERTRASLMAYKEAQDAAAAAAAAAEREESSDDEGPLDYFGREDIGGGRRKRRQYRRKWVSELLKTLNSDHEFDAGADSLVTVEGEELPHGWILTPVVYDVRESRGSRFLLDPFLGQIWEKLLGTDLYPDLLVSRRVCASNWAFQHATSSRLVKAALDWYLAAQDTPIKEGVSGWILDADRELGSVFAAFKRVKVAERLLLQGLPKEGERITQIYKLLGTIESRLLATRTEVDAVRPVSYEVFTRYVDYACRGFEIPRDQYHNVDGVHQILRRWANGKYGFRPGVDPLLSSWKRLWDVVMAGGITNERVALFLRTMDTWDPVESSALLPSHKSVIAADWVTVFIDNETLPDSTGRGVRSTVLHTAVKKWCYQFLPEALFHSNFSPVVVGPIFTRCNFPIVKHRDGRYVRGLRLKHPVDEVEMVAPPTTVGGPSAGAAAAAAGGAGSGEEEEDLTAEEGTGTSTVFTASTTTMREEGARTHVTKSHTVVGSMTAESPTARIEHYFTASVSKQEIHLGNL